MPIPQQFLDELVSRTDLVDLVSESVRLTKKGNSYWCCCPFHSEKTPSFHVVPDRQIYKCFGCGKGGGAINFVMELENLSFREAVEVLAKRAGMEVPDSGGPDAGMRARREKLLELNRQAARAFHQWLWQPEGARGLDYLQRRGLSKGTLTRFGLGYAPDGWDNLIRAMAGQGYDKRDLLDAGLAVNNKDGRIYDRFRSRVIFPIIDVRGSVIGFGGRVMDDSTPKYLNSPDTPVYNKSRNLFALNIAKKSKAGRVILTEGYMDTISLHQAGFDSAVASLGTSLTSEQANLLSRVTKQVVICYDADSAGVKAAQRAIPLLEKVGLGVRVVTVPEGKDPDEFIKVRGAEAFRALIEDSSSGVEYQLESAARGLDLESDAGKVAYLQNAAEVLSKMPDPVSREVYAMRVASQCSVRVEAVRDAIKQVSSRRVRREKRAFERENTRPERNMQPVGSKIRFENPASARAEMGLINLLYQSPEFFRYEGIPAPEDFSSPELGHIYSAMLELNRAGLETGAAELSSKLSGDEMSLFTSIIQEPVSLSNAERALDDYIGKINGSSRPREDEDLRSVAEQLKKTKGYGG